MKQMRHKKQTKQKTLDLLGVYRRNRLAFTARSMVIVAAMAVLVTQRTFWTPDTLFVVLLVIFAVFGQAKSFLVRFLPLVSLILLYEIFRGIADDYPA